MVICGNSNHEESLMSRGWVVTLAGTGINLALGILYTWSVIRKAIPGDWGWSDKQKQLPYAIACLVFSIMMVPAGRLQDKISPRWVASIGGLLVGAGMIFASFGDNSNLFYLVGFGVLAGAGIGFGYASATPPAVKWFPAARTGMIVGIVVSGFGLASVWAAKATDWLTNSYGVPSTMFTLGVAFLFVVVLLAQLLRTPPKGYVPPGSPPPGSGAAVKKENSSPVEMPPKGYAPPGSLPLGSGAAVKKENFSPTEMLATWQFYLLWFMYACGAGAGLMIISNLASLADDQAGLKLGFVLVAWLAVGNGAGRILAGTLSDKLGRKPTLMGCLLFQAVLMVVLTQATKESALATMPVMALLSALIGANYGANLALYPSITKDYYGLKNFGVNYGLVFTAWGVGGFALPLLAGWLKDRYQVYSYACYVAATLLVVAAVVTLLVRPPHAAHQEPAA
jgi:OFA family oxalate/formate antiporter-like MFS transporter